IKSFDYNFLLEGDNLHSLYLLEKTHKGKIDVIYIDPPYNTGNKDFVYDDKFVDSEDGYRHSKWLSFMQKRLIIAKGLLSDNGAIFISIDDNECVNLELLCNLIFGEVNKIANLPRTIKRGGKSTDKIAKNHDNLLIYSKNALSTKFNKIIIEDDQTKNLKDEYYSERGSYRLNQCLDYDSLQYNESMDYEIEIDGEKFYAGGSYEYWLERHNGHHKKIDWVWRWSKSLFEWGYKNGFVVMKKGKRKRIYTKTYSDCKIDKDSNGNYCIVKSMNSKVYDSLFYTDNIFSNDNGKKEFDKLNIKTKFDYPKPTALIRECIKMIANENYSTILDFFAGSGTTAQAVLELNKEDGGNRKFILCTNNENNICEEVTYQRIKTVITGTREDGSEYSNGIPANLKYYKTDFIEKSIDNLDDELNKHTKELVQLENYVDIDDKNVLLAFDNKGLTTLLKDADIKKIQKVYISRFVILNSEQKKLLKNKKIEVIPDYYFRKELKEKGLNWR
ncbi:MAG: site-specific DNA-methyltransferase, partial [Eubacteriales bacterium]|nr:site-specific DNA-methyltransferase [Eubacteriales bacterium]